MFKKSVHSMSTGKNIQLWNADCACGGSGRKVWDEKWIQGSLRHEDGRADMFIMDCGLFHCGLETDCRHVGAIFLMVSRIQSKRVSPSYIWALHIYVQSRWNHFSGLLELDEAWVVPCVRFSEIGSDEPLCPSESVVEVLLGGIVLIYLAMEGHGKQKWKWIKSEK